jgi:endonuclease YncB( thermonuclease family)
MPDITFGLSAQSRSPYDARLSRTVDGDTVDVVQPVRMVSIDTPEKAEYAGSPPVAQAKLDRCRQRLLDGTYEALPEPLRRYLIERITPDAAQRHIAASVRAAEEFAKMRRARLEAVPEGQQPKIGVIVTGEVIDENGRLLAYIAPWLKPPLPHRDDPRRKTFNLEMVEAGWAALFPIYPSLPTDDDFNRALFAAERAWTQKRGAWNEFGSDLLLGYEYRACIKLGAADNPASPIPPAARISEAFRRICVDVRYRTIYGRYGYHHIDPPHRLWIWPEHLHEARGVLHLRDQ